MQCFTNLACTNSLLDKIIREEIEDKDCLFLSTCFVLTFEQCGTISQKLKITEKNK